MGTGDNRSGRPVSSSTSVQGNIVVVIRANPPPSRMHKRANRSFAFLCGSRNACQSAARAANRSGRPISIARALRVGSQTSCEVFPKVAKRSCAGAMALFSLLRTIIAAETPCRAYVNSGARENAHSSRQHTPALTSDATRLSRTMRTLNARHIPAAATTQTSVDIIWLWKIAAAPNASNGHRALSPAITSHIPHAKSGRNAMASASPIALRVYISVSRYIASV